MKSALLKIIAYLPDKALAAPGRLSLIAFFLFSLFTLHFALLPSPVRAQANPCEILEGTVLSDYELVNALNNCAIKTASFDDKIFNLNATIGLVNSLNGLITGNASVTPAVAQLFQNHNALATTGSMIALMYAHPPASGIEYFAQQINKINPLKPAYAQTGTVGFNALAPVQALWTQFRNISYVGFVIVFIVIGFMIMFRAKVSAQTVATLQDSIPRIVVALILVTFSYALVGLMIDLMFVILNVAINALTPVIQPDRANKIIFEKNIITTITNSWGSIVGSTSEAAAEILGQVGFGGKILKIITFGTIDNIAGLVVGVAALFIMFKIFIMLLMAYVSIIIYTVFAPFMLLFQALPGNNGAVGWFKQIVANLSVFVAVALMVLFAGIFANIKGFGAPDSGKFIITEGKTQFPLLSGGIDVTTMSRLIGLGFLFMIPSVAAMIKEKLKAGSVGFGGPGAAALGATAGAFGGAAGRGAGFAAREGAERVPQTAGPASAAWWRQRQANRQAKTSMIAEGEAERSLPTGVKPKRSQ